MATPVYVYAMHEISAVFADLHGGKPLRGGFKRFASSTLPDGSPGHQVSYFWDFESPLVAGGRIKLARSGGSFPGLVEAERATALAMLYAVRVEYKIYPADYSFVKMIGKRPLFNTMRASFEGMKRTYAEMQLVVDKMHSALLTLCQTVSSWFGRAHNELQGIECVAVSAFHAALYEKCKSVEFGYRHAASLIEMSEKKDKELDEQKFFDMSVPYYEVVDWERSYYTLRTVMDNALKKLPGPASPVYTEYLQDGQVQASIYLPCDPAYITGEPANTKASAKAKLCYAVINHVHKHLKVPIYDLNYAARQYQEGYIARFDMKIKCVMGCADKLKGMVDGMGKLFECCEGELLPKLLDGGSKVELYDATGFFATNFDVLKDEFYACRARLQGMKVDTKEVQDFFEGSTDDEE